ncbi:MULTISPECIES: DUF4307 domain-containing protein [unclassified Mycobacterium]|uniref:DUF4307 domain-containing protein n=1 Tax=unclassified Mycobacterium TaxID=2642494 RepID=UPI000740277A|nr:MULTISPECIES: DUF4307 domain-containing protein [unclassified Mycobacterium]KUH86267.1 hypothetical protein AU187_05635 [Mycobacterium sp. IS-1556]KUH86790.1 hypothetical protein AU185_19620 [Mycobacterium sp. GA-0227b]KUH92069.1 hypothetical protein AU186_06335 [Mycobacterium sp. GA-1999]
MIERPAERYGRQRLSRRHRRWVAVGFTVLALAAGVAVAIVAFGRFGSDDVTGELSAYRLIDDETVSVTISVTREDPSRPVVCIVRARSIDGAETGRREVLVPPSEQTTVQVTAPVKATRQPVIGDIYGCGTDVPPYLVSP